MTNMIGRKLGRYELVEVLGSGGMATVYKAYQDSIDRHVAVKVLAPNTPHNLSFMERFRLEALTVARLQHPHIVPLYDYGAEDDVLYLVMSYLAGGTLADRIKAGRMSLTEVEKVVREVGWALDYAHRQGVIHRDVKPSNILLDRDGNTQLADFGLVKIMAGKDGLTISGNVMGTPAYMAPEQAQGNELTPLADVYALGALTYEMLTGTPPYTADTPMQLALMHITQPIPRLSAAATGLPPALDDVLARAMAKQPADRTPSAAAFVEAFQQAVLGSGTLPALVGLRPDQTLPREGLAPTPRQRMTAWAGSIGVLALVLVAVAFIAFRAGMLTLPQLGLAAGPTPATPATVVAVNRVGNLNFARNSVTGDQLRLNVENLPPPRQRYQAWLQNSATGDALALGTLSLSALGSGQLVYSDAQNRTLPALFNTLLITDEAEPGTAPGSPVAFSASTPPELSDALRSLLVADEAGVNGASLLQSATIEARTAATHAGLAAGSTSVGGMHTHAEHAINILRGTRDDLDGDGNAQNPGRGIGVLPMLDLVERHLDAAAQAPTATRQLQSQLELVRVCVVNTRVRTDRVIALELDLIASESVEAVSVEAAESAEVAVQILSGVDFNGNGVIEPFEAECGLDQIGEFALFSVMLDVVAGAPFDAEA